MVLRSKRGYVLWISVLVQVGEISRKSEPLERIYQGCFPSVISVAAPQPWGGKEVEAVRSKITK